MKRHYILSVTFTVMLALLMQSMTWAANTNNNAPLIKININSASVQQLQQLPHIGPKLAARIVKYRKEHGAFKSIEQIMKVKGIGEKRFKQIAPFIALSGNTVIKTK